MIIHVITGLNVGGAEQALKRLLLANSECSQESIVISLTDLGTLGAELKLHGVEVHTLGMKNVFSMPMTLYRLVKLIRLLKPDIVQSWLYHADLIGGVAAKIAGVKYIVWGIRTTELKQGSYITAIIRKLLALLSYFIPSKIVCVAEASKQKHINIGYCASKMVVIGNGFDLNQLQSSSEQRKLLRCSCGLSEEHLVIGSVGRLSQDKGQDIFIKTAALLVKTFPNIRFLMVGRGLDSSNSELMSWLDAARVADKFVLLGERKDVPACLSAMDVFCLHSRTEGFPNVLGEAMALGLPCVTTNVGDAAFLLSNTGIVASQNTPQSLFNAIEKLLGLSSKERKSMGESAKKRIKLNFTQVQTSRMYHELYRNMLNGIK